MKTTNAAATLASVVFLKIQEFARRPVQEQTRLRAQLEAVVAVTAAELAPAGRIVLDAADGAAIVLGATAVILIVGAGVAVRVSLGGHPKFLDGMIAKLGISVKDGETYIRGLREKLKL